MIKKKFEKYCFVMYSLVFGIYYVCRYKIREDFLM